MIKKLKKKFIILATISMAVLMTTLVLIMNIINLSSVISESDGVLDVLAQPNAPFNNDVTPPEKKDTKIDDYIPHDMSPEVPYESRYFTATVNTDGEIVDTNFTKIVSVNEDEAEGYINEVIAKENNRGFVKTFRYLKSTDEKKTTIMFLDCGRKLDTFYSFMKTSILIGVLGCLVVFVVFLFSAERIVKPISESYEKQKRFITDAGHEIKTPLTIIGANVDLLELDIGDNESLTEIRGQTKRLAELTKDLVFLTKMEETDNEIPKIDFPLSDLINETAQPFNAIAVSHNKYLSIHVQENVTMHGSPDEIRKLTSILLDNAMKYSPDGGAISLKLSVQKKILNLIVTNSTSERIDKDSLDKVFDRFYRMDLSRNSSTGGHGIGLSIARAIVDGYNGKITATTNTGNDFCISVSIPL